MLENVTFKDRIQCLLPPSVGKGPWETLNCTGKDDCRGADCQHVGSKGCVVKLWTLSLGLFTSVLCAWMFWLRRKIPVLLKNVCFT